MKENSKAALWRELMTGINLYSVVMWLLQTRDKLMTEKCSVRPDRMLDTRDLTWLAASYRPRQGLSFLTTPDAWLSLLHGIMSSQFHDLAVSVTLMSPTPSLNWHKVTQSVKTRNRNVNITDHAEGLSQRSSLSLTLSLSLSLTLSLSLPPSLFL